MQQMLSIRFVAVSLLLLFIATSGFYTSNRMLLRKLVEKSTHQMAEEGSGRGRTLHRSILFAIKAGNNDDTSSSYDAERVDRNELFRTWDPEEGFKQSKGILPVGPPKTAAQKVEENTNMLTLDRSRVR